MANEAEHQQQQQTTIEQSDDESRGLEIRDAGSLRVEERTQPVTFQSLADLYEQRGFFAKGAASVGWDEFRSLTYTPGTSLIDLNPVRPTAAGYGYDQRWIYPALPSVAVSDATTAVQILKQTARSLAGTSVIRALDATTTKPETSTTVDYQTLQLSQVATVQSGVPRIHAAQPLFASLIEQDLRYAINDGLDTLTVRGLATSSFTATCGTV